MQPPPLVPVPEAVRTPSPVEEAPADARALRPAIGPTGELDDAAAGSGARGLVPRPAGTEAPPMLHGQASCLLRRVAPVVVPAGHVGDLDAEGVQGRGSR